MSFACRLDLAAGFKGCVASAVSVAVPQAVALPKRVPAAAAEEEAAEAEAAAVAQP